MSSWPSFTAEWVLCEGQFVEIEEEKKRVHKVQGSVSVCDTVRQLCQAGGLNPGGLVSYFCAAERQIERGRDREEQRLFQESQQIRLQQS